jgi:TRAP-type C4-dicarboxylate transport system permease small subunit
MENVVEPQSNVKESGLSKFILRVSSIMASVGAISLFVMMVITVIDVGGREFFLKPLNGSFELIGIMLVIAGSWGIAYCQVIKLHIRIGLIVDKFPERLRKLCWILTLIVGGVMCGLIAWQGLVKTIDLLTSTLGNTTDTLGLPIWPFMLVMTLGFLWTCVVFFAEIFQQLAEKTSTMESKK